MTPLLTSTPGPKAFISYSHADDRDGYITDLRKALEIEVQIQLGQRFTIFQDVDIEAGQDFQEIIQSSLSEVLLFIPVISPSYFNSPYCRSELSAFLKREVSLSRRDLVLPLYYVDTDIMDDNKEITGESFRLEAAVKKHQFTDWRKLREKPLSAPDFRPSVIKLSAAIKEAVRRSPPSESRSQEEFDSSVDEIRIILDELRTRVQATRFKRKFRSGITLRLLTAARDEIQRLTGGADTYKQDLSLEENFIVRAGPIFEEASQVYAISIDQYSEFWVAEDQRSRAEEYTSRQPANSVRLFVFSSMEIAQRYRYVLAGHYSQYGRDGAVLFTSKSSYKNFLANIDVDKVPELLQKDFAILIFSDRKVDSSGTMGEEQEFFEATLSKTKLVCEQLTVLEGYHHLFIEAFEDFRSNLSEGQLKIGVMKWHESFKFDDAMWSAALSKTFGITDSDALAERPVYHIVFLAPSMPGPTVIKYVEERVRLSLEQLLSKATGDPLVDELWFGSRNELINSLEVVDGKYGGTLRTKNVLAQDYPFCLVLKLRNIEALREYYENPLHSDIRRELLCFCEPKFREMYELLEAPSKLSEDEKSIVYNAIEAAAGVVYSSGQTSDWKALRREFSKLVQSTFGCREYHLQNYIRENTNANHNDELVPNLSHLNWYKSGRAFQYQSSSPSGLVSKIVIFGSKFERRFVTRQL